MVESGLNQTDSDYITHTSPAIAGSLPDLIPYVLESKDTVSYGRGTQSDLPFGENWFEER